MLKINVEHIYNQIPQKIKDFGFGYVAGSWVAAEIFKQLNLPINPIANDIDWFVDEKTLSQQESKYESTKLFQNIYLGNKHKINNCSFIFDRKITSSQYNGINTIDRSLYKIVSARQLDEDINIVVVDFYLQKEAFVFSRLKALVLNFDFNAVQVGIDIKTKQLFMSDDFIEFCKTLQLEIMNVWTPSHTMVRYLKKLQTMCLS